MTRKKAEKARENGGSKDNVEERAESLINEANALLTYKEPEGNRQKGIAFLQEAIELGSVKAMYRLGQVYENGGIISTDRGKSIELYTLAAENHHEDAIIALAKLYYNDETIEDHYNLAMKVIDKYLVLFNGEANYLKGLMLWNGQGVEINARMAIGHMTFAAMTGHMKAAAFLGNVYENGHKADLRFDTYDPRQVEPNQCNAAHFYEIAAVKGDRNSKYKLALMKIEGLGTNHDYQGAFLLLWDAAILWHGKAQLELAKFYVSELLFPKDMKASMYWAMMSLNYDYNPKANDLIEELKAKLSKFDFLKLQQVVLTNKSTPHKIIDGIEGLLKPRDYYINGNGYAYKSDDSAESSQDTESLSSHTVQATQIPNETTELYENIESSETMEYEYAKQLGKSIDSSKIKLALVLNNKLKDTDKVDFHKLVISYNNQKHDRKDVELYTGDKVKLTKAARRLLIKLALQFDTKDIEKRNSDIAEILTNQHLSSYVVSDINRLANNLFPGCFNKNCPFICKASGELKINLSIDKWMIENAKDFHEVSRLK